MNDNQWCELYKTIDAENGIKGVMIGASSDEPTNREITLYQVNSKQNWDRVYLTKNQIKSLIEELKKFL